MAEQSNQNPNLGGESILELLSDSIGENIAKRNAAKAPVPDVYKSGMRGNEKPPAQREAAADKKAKQALNKGTANGKKEVAFTARERKSQKDKIADLEKQVADLTAAAGKGKEGKKKLSVNIA
jgi:hypothetical protein